MPKPKVIIFNGISLDGRMEGAGTTADMGLYYELADSWKADAMLSGSNTMLQAAAFMETPPAIPGGRKELHPLAVPYLVVVDSRGRIPNWSALQAQPYWGDVIALCSETSPDSYRQSLDIEGIHHIVAGRDKVDLGRSLILLNERYGIHTVRVDSGGILNGVLLRAGLVDEVSVLLAPELVGGMSPRSLFVAPDIIDSEQVIHLQIISIERVRGDHIWLRYSFEHRESNHGK